MAENKEKISAEKFIEEFVNDVEKFCDKMLEYQNQKQQEVANKPLEEIRELIKSVYKEEEIYRGRKPDFAQYERETIVAALKNNEKEINNDNLRELLNSYKEIMINISKIEDKTKLSQLESKKNLSTSKLIAFWNSNISEEKKEEYLKNIYIKRYPGLNSHIETRRAVQEEFNNVQKDKTNIIAFNEELDKGSCTKAITLSLFKLQEKYGITLFPNTKDIEQIAHPITFIELIGSKYQKNNCTDNIEDVEGGVQRGDVVFLSDKKGTPKHAMMCYDFNDKKEPMLLSFSSVCKEISAYKQHDGEPRKGLVVNIKSFLEDRVDEHYNKKTLINTKKDNER